MNEKTKLFYEDFDHQLEALLAMSGALTSCWRYYSMMELNCDIRSLCSKAMRLGQMADEDMARQQADLSDARHNENRYFHQQFGTLLEDSLIPMMRQYMDESSNKHVQRSNVSGVLPPSAGELLDILAEKMGDEDENKVGWGEVAQSFVEVEQLIRKKQAPVKFPGVPPEQRLWMLAFYFLQVYYLRLHFRNASALFEGDAKTESAGMLLSEAIHHYAETKEGDEELTRYMAVLHYNNDGEPLSQSQLEAARKHLIDDVPKSLQTVYIQYHHDLEKLGRKILAANPTQQEYMAMLDVLAKQQRLNSQLLALNAPVDKRPRLYNEVFRSTDAKGRPIDLYDLRDRIERMVRHITFKNQWFCLWCVLRHHHLLQLETMETFAHQMMHRDWFGHIDKRFHFDGDNIRDFNGYLTSCDYSQWEFDAFRLHLAQHPSKKININHFNKFLHTIAEMEASYESL